LEVAALAFVIGKRRGLANPDEALFAGLVHDLGHFYLMWRATKFPDITAQPEELRSIVHDWHPGIGAALLQSLDLPETVSRACDEHALSPAALPSGSLSELISLSNRCAASRANVTPPEVIEDDEWSSGTLYEETTRAILDEAAKEVEALIAALKG